jgi:hypothetical protein
LAKTFLKLQIASSLHCWLLRSVIAWPITFYGQLRGTPLTAYPTEDFSPISGYQLVPKTVIGHYG